MPKKSTKSNSETPVITSPDGVQIQITAGRKWKFCRHYMRSDRTPLQKNIMIVLIDMTNEGTGENAARFGLAYPSIETLAKETGSSKSGVKKGLDGLKALGDLKLMGEKKSQGGRDKVNEYWLPGWNEFGLISDIDGNRSHSDTFSERETGHSETETGHSRTKTGHSETETGHSEDINRSHSGPDSSSESPQRSTSSESPHRNTSSHSKSASGGGPVDDDVSDRPTSETIANDNDAKKVAEYQRAAVRVWNVFQKAPIKEYEEFVSLFVELVQAKEITSSQDVISSLRAYQDCTDLKYQMNPVRFLKERKWKEYRPVKKKLKMATAI
ncbi:hypothetical protein [Nitrobacter winogradskyi]|uniref:Uncharacterized protein n=2 Tax=Nitrobacter winogradskyi TaxID=913 RepID=A0ACC6AH25_NITWI|nr:hypothetical protein [Nitrobacter winogradskyi]MCP1999153.1 hypothetical protein [Nitrobacter winogradskyi]GEC14655.1 hypothetical protein NWI01_05470 [Nitrobacter winogradskyi]